ncbi:hypothetical protein ABT009_20080 [Streptomyces sp. NPDC002896]|uniref:hypothetical protein n=1 Tax=Streptomyces sp. NPDC002896 TaxID=3154438 RepID=UPI00332A1F5A
MRLGKALATGVAEERPRVDAEYDRAEPEAAARAEESGSESPVEAAAQAPAPVAG